MNTLSGSGIVHSEPQLVTRDFTVATFVVHAGAVLLLRHRKLGLWLPPGGHIDPHELPDEAAIREVREETGVHVELVGEYGPCIPEPGAPRPLRRPEGIQLETIRPGHEHIDLIYFARCVDEGGNPLSGDAPEPHVCDEHQGAGWYGPTEWTNLGVNCEVQEWCRRAILRLSAETP